jgi:sulfur carrier protein
MTDDAPVVINGCARTYRLGLSIPALITELLPVTDDSGSTLPDGVAVAVNGSVVPRTQWLQRPIEPGDRIEVVTAVQGG